MLIGKNWKIEADTLNVILSKRRLKKPKDGKPALEYWEAMGYYSSVANALKDLVNYELRETALVDLRTIVNKINELHKLIESVSDTL